MFWENNSTYKVLKASVIYSPWAILLTCQEIILVEYCTSNFQEPQILQDRNYLGFLFHMAALFLGCTKCFLMISPNLFNCPKILVTLEIPETWIPSSVTNTDRQWVWRFKTLLWVCALEIRNPCDTCERHWIRGAFPRSVAPPTAHVCASTHTHTQWPKALTYTLLSS